MNYAVIKTGGKQYRVSPGETLTVDKLIQDEKKAITFDEVLLIVNEDKVTLGKPLVSGAKVQASFIEDIKGEKIQVRKFKAKSRYRKTTGFRAQLSVVKIDKIETGSKETERKTKEPVKTAEKVRKKVN
jgi:large subunit ribosomal protein L21